MPQIVPRKTVHLDAAATIGLIEREPDGRFAWELIAAPDGSESPLRGHDGLRAEFTPDVAGRYLIRLHATTARGNTHHVIRVCAGEDSSVALTTLEIKTAPAN